METNIATVATADIRLAPIQPQPADYRPLSVTAITNVSRSLHQCPAAPPHLLWVIDNIDRANAWTDDRFEIMPYLIALSGLFRQADAVLVITNQQNRAMYLIDSATGKALDRENYPQLLRSGRRLAVVSVGQHHYHAWYASEGNVSFSADPANPELIVVSADAHNRFVAIPAEGFCLTDAAATALQAGFDRWETTGGISKQRIQQGGQGLRDNIKQTICHEAASPQIVWAEALMAKLERQHQPQEALATASDEDSFFDARDQQPWLLPASVQEASWPLNTLATQVKNAIHYQLSLLSRATLASNLLNVIHPDLSKLLAAVLICSRQGSDILWQAGISGGGELLNRLINLVAGATSGAAILTSLPALLIIWLQRHQVSLSEGITDTLMVLLNTGLTLCAYEDIAQPGWLVTLHHEVIEPAVQLCRDSGVTEVVTTGITLILALYTMLRFSGCLEGKMPTANIFSHGIRIIQGICQLSQQSQAFQRIYDAEMQQKQAKAWYQRTHPGRPDDEFRVNKALDRAVIRAMPRELLWQRERQQAESAASENYYQRYQDTRQKILSRQQTTMDEVTISPLNRINEGGIAIGEASSAAEKAATVPLLVSSATAVVAATATQHNWWHGRTSLFLPITVAGGVTLLAGARYIRNSLTPPAVTTETENNALNADSNICLSVTNNIRQLLHSDKTGVTLAAELFDYLLEKDGDINLSHAEQLLNKLNVTTFKSTERNEMNAYLLYLLSVIFTPASRNQPVDINSIVFSMGRKINFIWIHFINTKKNSAIKFILQELRVHCAKEYLALGVFSRSDMSKITDFLISMVAPDLLFLERNGRGEVQFISKEIYYIWNYLGKQFTDNLYVRNDEYATAVIDGRIDAFVIARIRSYPSYNTTTDREYLENAYKDINNKMYEYQKNDTKLEFMPVISFDDIIKVVFPGIDIHVVQDFHTIKLRIQTQGRIEAEIRTLQKCKSFRDIIRNFEDGFGVLYHYLPEKIPESLRDYVPGDGKLFTLKEHLSLSELYQKFDQSYQQMIEQHCETYRSIVESAFKILPEEEAVFLNNTQTRLYSIDVTVKRFKLLRYLLQPACLNFLPQFTERVSYNERPYNLVGKIFFGYNSQKKEKRYYALHIEASRVQRQLPIKRLALNNTADIFNPQDRLLNEIFLFLDEQSFFDPCIQAEKPNTTLLSSWDQTGKFISQRFDYYRGLICEAVRNPREIIISYNERRVGDQNTTPLNALINEITDNRKKLLTHLKAKAHNPTKVEQDKEKGILMQLAELFPFYNCFELFRDIFFIKQDVTPPSMLIPAFQTTICAADFYMAYGIKKNLASLLQSLRTIYIQRWMRKNELSVLNLQLEEAIIQSSPVSHVKPIREKIRQSADNMNFLDNQIIESHHEIRRIMGSLLSIPVYIAFPYLSLSTRKGFLSANIPWGVNVAKMFAKDIYSRNKVSELQVPWSNPQAAESVENEKYILPHPREINVTCEVSSARPDNTLLDIFDLRGINPTLYQKLFFVALSDPNPAAIIGAAENGGWIIPERYNQMAMFCFISLTIPARSYTNMILAKEDYYKTDKRKHIKITEEALYRYYADFLSRPYINPPVEITSDQKMLIDQTIKTIKALLTSNVQGVELSYLFMIQYLLMSEDMAALWQTMNGKVSDQQRKWDLMLQDLSYNLEKFTIYGASHNPTQKKFHAAVIKHFFHYCKQSIASNDANITLFSPNIETFLQRLEQYLDQHPDAIAPTLASFTSNWLQLEQDISAIYHAFARVEYSAKALAGFPVDKWREKSAQEAWQMALQTYLFPEMHYEMLTPVLNHATEFLSQSWQQRQIHADRKLAIISNGVVNPLFIDDVSKALTTSCALYPRLFFCQVYLTDNGYWFTFLTNDFMSEPHHRPRRQLHSLWPSWPLSAFDTAGFNETVVLATKQLQTSLKPDIHFNNQPLYQKQLINVLNTFIRFASRPFHQRLRGHELDKRPLPESATQRDAIELINSVIDAQGNIVDYQLCVLCRYLPPLDVADRYPLLRLLSDLLHMTSAATANLYEFIADHLQIQLADPQLSLSRLSELSFSEKLISDIYRRYLPQLKSNAEETQHALRRYITATLRHLLSFSNDLADVEALLATAPLTSHSSQLLSLGAIISRQLRAENSPPEELLRLAWAAQHDAGLLSLRETAIHQLALVSGARPGTEGHQVNDALKAMAANVKKAAETQQHIFSCLEASQRLALFLHRLTLSSLPEDVWLQLRALITAALQNQRKLLQLTLHQLAANEIHRLNQALKSGKLQATWHLAAQSPLAYAQVAGFAFNVINQQGILLPLGNPQSVPLIFRQQPLQATKEALAQLCFSFTTTNRTLLEPVKITLPAVSQTDSQPVAEPATVLSDWMHSELQTRVNALAHSGDESAFIQLKETLNSWLTQHLFFFGQDDASHYHFIPEQNEHLSAIAAHADIAQWLQQNNSDITGSSPASRFSQAISEVMGASTDWPALVNLLRSTTPTYGTTPLASLPEKGFAGFWWDPLSRLCYLGWQAEGKRLLYASLIENREALYLLTDDETISPIWPSLTLFDWLQQDIQALRRGAITVQRFFDNSIPLAWQLQCAMAEAFPLPAGAIRHPLLAAVYTHGRGKQQQSYFSPGISDAVIPVTVTELPGAGFRIDFSPRQGKASPDLSFTLETNPPEVAQEGKWTVTPHEGWQLLAERNASQLIQQGIFSPTAYLQWGNGSDGQPAMLPASRLLQRSDGSLVFMFSEDNYRHISYRILDDGGKLQPSPTFTSEFPHAIMAANAQQFNLAIDRIIAEQRSADYWLLLQPGEQQRAESDLASSQDARWTAIIAASSAIDDIPFRFGNNREAVSELFNIIIRLRSFGRDFYREVKQNAKQENTDLSIGGLLWEIFDWRDIDLYNPAECDAALRKIALEKQLLTTMQAGIAADNYLHYHSEKLQVWIKQSIELMTRATTAIGFIKGITQHASSATDAVQNLQRQHFAQNYFFSYYNQQLHASADLFQQPWLSVRDSRLAPGANQSWQQALDQLHTLATELPLQEKTLDRLLTLPDVLWQAPEMQQAAQQWLNTCQRLVNYWRTPQRAEQIIVLRPKASAQDMVFMPQKYHWPIRLILTAGKGDPTGNQTEGVAPAWRISMEQHEDLLLIKPGPAAADNAEPRLAGINAQPGNARHFVAWTRLRLSSPWALGEFSGSAFWSRLQDRIQLAITDATTDWGEEEREFFALPDTADFLQESLTLPLEPRRYGLFLRQLFNSNVLFTRLIMTDVEMLFGLLCDHFVVQHPDRASEDLSKAWFLFQQTAEQQQSEGDEQPSIWLLGV
ncbi:hypothetical protein [Pantoea sp. B65]|uniref:hypothetical protein n=1 Tax=Pantoea sp. B65 TaxID=2813359 RepID=UPI0039B434F2